VGAVPLTAAAVVAFHLNGREMNGFWVRDKTKTHGTKKLIEGGPVGQGTRVVILDDVLTTGSTAEACARALRRAGAARVELISWARVVRPAQLMR